MDRKVLTTIGLCVGIVFLWKQYVMVPDAPEKPPVVAPADPSGKPADPAKPADPTAKPADPAKPAEPTAKPADPAKPGDPAAKPAPTRQPEVFTKVEGPRFRAAVTSWGGSLHDFTLLDERYKESAGPGGGQIPIDLVNPKGAPLPFSVSFPDSGFELPADADFTLDPTSTATDLRYMWETETVKVTKHYEFHLDAYEFPLSVTVENKSDKPLAASMRLTLSGRQDPEVQASVFRPSIQTEGLCSTGKVKREPLASLLKEPLEVSGPVRVVAIDRKYFVLAAAIAPSGGEKCKVTGDPAGRIVATLTTGAESLAPGKSKTWHMLAFAGPKIVAELDAVKVDGVDAHLGDVMNYGMMELLARPMLWVLKTIHRGIGNWGVAVILLTLLIKLVTWWPTAQSMKSAAAMARLKPEMDKLKEKHGDDKAKMNQEVMLLYQKHKINPLGGCLPVLLQMPVYIALYSMLGNSVELYHAPLGFWIRDLTASDPFFVLPLLTGGIMFLQQKLSPTPPDPSQKTMMTIMPLMFTGMSIFLPAGLTLYILTNTALSMVQQRISTPGVKGGTPAAIAPSKKKAN